MSGNQEKRFLSRSLKSSRYTRNNESIFCICVGSPSHFTTKDLEWVIPDVAEYFRCLFSEYAQTRAINLYGLLIEHQYTRITVRPVTGAPLTVAYDGGYVYFYRGTVSSQGHFYASKLEVKL